MSSTLGGPGAAEWLALLKTALATLTPADAPQWLAEHRPLLLRLLEGMLRDPRFRALLQPGQITVEPGTDQESFDFEGAEIAGLEKSLDAMGGDLSGYLERLQVGLGGGSAAGPLTEYRELIGAIAQLLVEDPKGKRATALPALLAALAGAAEAGSVESGAAPRVRPAETLAVAHSFDWKYLRKDAERLGAGPGLGPPHGEADRLAELEAAVWQTPTAGAGAPVDPAGLSPTAGRVKRLRSQARRALLDSAKAEIPEARMMPQRSKHLGGTVELDAAGGDRSGPEAADGTSEVELAAFVHLRREEANRERNRAGISDRTWRLILAGDAGQTVAQAAFELGMTPKAAQKAVERARARLGTVRREV